MKARVALLETYEKGYRINNEGCAISPSGNKMRFRKAGKGGYYHINYKKNNVNHAVPYHRLMAYQKFGDLLFAADCVRHLNGNHLDNSYDNIEIGTLSDNMMDKSKEIRLRTAINATPIKYSNVDEIRMYYNTCHSYKKTMEKFNISSKGTLHYILNSRVILGDKPIAI
jgi:hypothetical protein